jgi:hypothetical protein
MFDVCHVQSDMSFEEILGGMPHSMTSLDDFCSPESTHPS